MRTDYRFDFAGLFKIGDHLFVPLTDFFGLLKTQVHGSLQFGFKRLQLFCKSQENRDMTVMTARVHAARMFRFERKPRLLFYRQRIDVGAERIGFSAQSAFYTCGGTVLADLFIRNAQLCQFFSDIFGGLFFLQRHFRYPMEFTPQRDNVFFYIVRHILLRVKLFSFFFNGFFEPRQSFLKNRARASDIEPEISVLRAEGSSVV